MKTIAWGFCHGGGGLVIKKDVLVVSNHREVGSGSFGNVQFHVHYSGVTNNRFGERHDVILYKCAHEFCTDGVQPQASLREKSTSSALNRRHRK